MTVENITPYVSIIANGNDKRFSIPFYVEDKANFVVKQNDILLEHSMYIYRKADNSITLRIVPEADDKIEIERQTVLERAESYKSKIYRSRSEVLDKELDKLWLSLQEQNYSLNTIQQVTDEIKDSYTPTDVLENSIEQMNEALRGKVEKEAGKSLTTNDFTHSYKAQLDTILDTVDSIVEEAVQEVSSLTNESLQGLSDDLETLENKLDDDYYNKTYIDQLDNRKVETITLESYSTTSQINSNIDSKITTYETNIASNKYKLRSDLIPNPQLYGVNGLLTVSPKIFIGTTVANSEGDWTINYSHVGFTQIPVVTATGQNVGTALADKRFASLNTNQPTLTRM